MRAPTALSRDAGDGQWARARPKGRTRPGGFTLIELVVTLALVGVMALVAVPLYEVTAVRMKEAELRTALRQIRTALDQYKDASDAGKIQKDPSDSGFPPSLKVLVDGVDVVQNSNSLGSALKGSAPPSFASSASTGSPAGAPDASNGPSRLMFLRQVPRDPFTPDPSLPPEEQWDTRSYGSPPSDPQPGKDVYDVMSKATGVGSNGIAYKDW